MPSYQTTSSGGIFLTPDTEQVSDGDTFLPVTPSSTIPKRFTQPQMAPGGPTVFPSWPSSNPTSAPAPRNPTLPAGTIVVGSSGPVITGINKTKPVPKSTPATDDIPIGSTPSGPLPMGDLPTNIPLPLPATVTPSDATPADKTTNLLDKLVDTFAGTLGGGTTYSGGSNPYGAGTSVVVPAQTEGAAIAGSAPIGGKWIGLLVLAGVAAAAWFGFRWWKKRRAQT